MKKNIFFYLYIFIFFFLISQSSFSYSLKLDTLRIYKDAKPGDIIEGVINVINDKDTPTVIEMEIEDIDFDSKSQNMAFKPFGTQIDSCSRWITLTPKKTQIPASASRGINYVITVPNDNIQLAEYYSIIFVSSSTDTPNTAESIVLASKARIGVVVKLTIQTLSKPSGIIESFNVTPQKNDTPLEMTYVFKNTGNILQKVTGSFSIIDLNGNLFGRGNINSGVAKKDESIEIKTKWDGELDPGTYDLITEFKFRPDNVEIREVRFESEYKAD